jgi:hypothetical protein
MQSGDCTTLGGGLPPGPAGTRTWDGYFMPVGAAISQWPASDVQCPTPGGNKYKCFAATPETSVAADPTTPYKVYVAFVAATNNPTTKLATNSAIYFTKSSGNVNCGTNCPWGTWTTPVALTTVASGFYYYDPQITVDAQGTIIVSYSQIGVAPADTSGNALFILSMSTDYGGT